MSLLLREALGESLRHVRASQGRTLRDVSTQAQVSLGYLSEIERGRKEASSELLAAICEALDIPLADVLSQASDTIAESGAPDVVVDAAGSGSCASPPDRGAMAVAGRIVIPAPVSPLCVRA